MFLKSKWFWISTVLASCTVIFVGIVLHRTSHPQEVIKIYKYVEPAPRKKAKSLTDAAVTRQTRRNTLIETDAANTNLTDLPKGASHYTNSGTDTPEDLPTELNQLIMADTVDEAAYHAEKAKQIYQELHTNFDTYLEALKENDRLSKIKVDVEKDEHAAEFISLRIQVAAEMDRLKRTVIEKMLSYISHAQDASPFLPGGEFYDLFQNNDIYITVNVAR